MGQKVNPISLRLQQTNRRFDNCWYTNYFYKKLVSRDIYLQQYINNFLKLVKLPGARFSIQYSTKNIKLYSFLCYPKLSREMRSKMFGIIVRKNKKKSQKFIRGKNKKNTLKFLVNPRLKRIWSLHYNPLILSKYTSFNWNNKSLNNTIVNKKSTQINIQYFNTVYSTLLLHLYKNKSVLAFKSCINKSGDFLLSTISKQVSKKGKHQLLYVPFGCYKFNKSLKNRATRPFQFYSIKLDRTNNKNIRYSNDFLQQNNYLLNFIKNLIINLFFIKFVKINLKKNTLYQNKNLSNFNIQYRKNFLKFFYIFYILFIKYNSNQIPINLKINTFLNQLYCFSNFQSFFIFHTIFQNRTPLNFLIKNQSLLSKNNNYIKYINTIKNRDEKIMKQLKNKNYIQSLLSYLFNINTEFVPFGVSQDWQSAGFLADEIVYFLERRVTFRRLKGKIIKNLSKNSNIRGVRISCSGRVGGKSKKAQRAKTECIKYGQTSRHTFSSQIDFAARTARTRFGSVGIKVWICYN